MRPIGSIGRGWEEERHAHVPKALRELSKLSVDVTYGNDENPSELFLVPTSQGDRLVKLWLGVVNVPDAEYPPYMLQVYEGDVDLPSRVSVQDLAEWHDGDASSSPRWEDVWEGDDPDELVREFESLRK